MFEENNNSISPMMTDKFKFFKKWFWIGVVISFLNFFAGLIYGVALVVEKEHRKEGISIIVLSIVVIALIIIFVLPWMARR